MALPISFNAVVLWNWQCWKADGNLAGLLVTIWAIYRTLRCHLIPTNCCVNTTFSATTKGDSDAQGAFAWSRGMECHKGAESFFGQPDGLSLPWDKISNLSTMREDGSKFQPSTKKVLTSFKFHQKVWERQGLRIKVYAPATWDKELLIEHKEVLWTVCVRHSLINHVRYS